MKKLLLLLSLFIALKSASCQRKSIEDEDNVLKKQLDLDIQLLGFSFSFKKKLYNSNVAVGFKTGFGYILSSPEGSALFFENIYFQPIINWNYKQLAYIETGPRISIVTDASANSTELIGLSFSVFVKLWKMQIGTRTQLSFTNNDSSPSKNNMVLSQEPIILRFTLSKKSKPTLLN